MDMPFPHSIQLVLDFAVRLGKKLAMPFHDVVTKCFQNEQQKQNRFHQCKNLDGVFAIDPALPEGPAFLVDDVVDSGDNDRTLRYYGNKEPSCLSNRPGIVGGGG